MLDYNLEKLLMNDDPLKSDQKDDLKLQFQ